MLLGVAPVSDKETAKVGVVELVRSSVLLAPKSLAATKSGVPVGTGALRKSDCAVLKVVPLTSSCTHTSMAATPAANLEVAV